MKRDSNVMKNTLKISVFICKCTHLAGRVPGISSNTSQGFWVGPGGSYGNGYVVFKKESRREMSRDDKFR